MEVAHTATQSSTDRVLAAFLEPGTLSEVATRANMSLASLAKWASTHADLLTSMHTLITTRCRLIAAHLELAALNALAAVSSAASTNDDPKARERALERQRKAANAILRHRTWLERAPRASAGPRAPRESANASSANTHAEVTASAASPHRDPSPATAAPSQPKLSIAQRLAAKRLDSLTRAHQSENGREGMTLAPA